MRDVALIVHNSIPILFVRDQGPSDMTPLWNMIEIQRLKTVTEESKYKLSLGITIRTQREQRRRNNEKFVGEEAVTIWASFSVPKAHNHLGKFPSHFTSISSFVSYSNLRPFVRLAGEKWLDDCPYFGDFCTRLGTVADVPADKEMELHPSVNNTSARSQFLLMGWAKPSKHYRSFQEIIHLSQIPIFLFSLTIK